MTEKIRRPFDSYNEKRKAAENKLCTDCKWHKFSWKEAIFWWGDTRGGHVCTHDRTQLYPNHDVVTGKKYGFMTSCETSRNFGGSCGSMAVYWEPKDSFDPDQNPDLL